MLGITRTKTRLTFCYAYLHRCNHQWVPGVYTQGASKYMQKLVFEKIHTPLSDSVAPG